MYKLYLFDFDGTLIDSDPLVEQIFKELYQKYKPNEVITKEKLLTFSGPPIKDTLSKEFPLLDSSKLAEEFLELSFKYNKTLVKTYPGVVELLEYLKKNNIKFALITSKQKASTMQVLHVNKLDSLFDLVITSDDVKACKPDPEGVYFALKHFNISNKKDVIYIGDSEFDYLVSKNAGVDFGYVLFSPRKIDKEAKVDVKIKSFIDYLSVLKNEKK